MRQHIAHRFFIFIWVLIGFQTFAQDSKTLTVEEAVSIALENNFLIKIVSNDAKIDEASVSPGFAGMLPSLNAVAENNNGIQNIQQTRSDGTVLSRNNARNTNL